MNRKVYLVLALLGLSVSVGTLYLTTQISGVASWTARTDTGSSDPIPLQAGPMYHLGASDGCLNFRSFNVSVSVVEVASGAVAYSSGGLMRAPAHKCTLAVSFADFSVPRDGLYRVDWSMDSELAARAPGFYLETAPMSANMLAFLLLGGFLAFVAGLAIYADKGPRGRAARAARGAKGGAHIPDWEIGPRPSQPAENVAPPPFARVVADAPVREPEPLIGEETPPPPPA